MALFRSVLFALFFYPWTALCVLTAFPASLLGTRALRACAHVWAKGHRWGAKHLLGIRSRIDGIIPPGAHLFAVKHQSMYETLEMFLLLSEPAVVLKKELTRIPLWGWVVRRYGVIPIDRAGGAAALREMMRSAQAAVTEGRPILIFPEGTRVSPGEMPPLQSGFAGLYRALKLPVVPVALDSGRLWPKNAFIKRAGVITLRVEPAIAPGLPREEVEALVHRSINRLEPSP
jgi:1-acyl-sn-glycerol-3-phosphate acyltransferase